MKQEPSARNVALEYGRISSANDEEVRGLRLEVKIGKGAKTYARTAEMASIVTENGRFILSLSEALDLPR